MGDGGAVTSRSGELADRIRLLRFHGSRDKRTFHMVGHNSRLDELQAGILRVLLPHLDAWADGRRAAAHAYADAGLGELVSLPEPTPGSEPAWHLYVVRHERADDLVTALGAAGIGSRAYYRTPIHRQPAMAAFGDVELPVTDELARTHLALPVSAAMRRDQVDEVVAAVRDADLG
jgi:dTDP-3-amino-3,4,6-trideoxy-alpha-D-glucose transaminase